MSNGIKIRDANGTVLLDTTTITYTLLGTLYCPAGQSASATFSSNGLTPFAQVYPTDTFSVTTAPTLATATITTSGSNTTCSMAGGTIGCTALVFAK